MLKRFNEDWHVAKKIAGTPRPATKSEGKRSIRPDSAKAGPKSRASEVQQLTKDLERRVAERTHQVRELTTSLVRAEQRERRRLSETLHDELQQLLYGVQLKLRIGRDELAAGRTQEAGQQLVQAETLLSRCTRVTRQLGVDLNPPILKNEGLNAILGWLQGQMRELHGLNVSLITDGEIRIDDSDVRVLVFQIFRELLFNVAKYSGAERATVSLCEMGGHVEANITDGGRGFDASKIGSSDHEGTSIGLKSVRERLGLIGGELKIESRPGNGTSITMRLPRSARIGG